MSDLFVGAELHNIQLPDMDRFVPDIRYSIETNVVELENNILVIPFPDLTAELDEFAPMKDALLHGLGTTFFNALKEPVEAYMDRFEVDTTTWDSYGIWQFGEQTEAQDLIDDTTQWHRRISISYFLNDNYEGGLIEFPHFGVQFQPKQGDLLIHPSGYSYKHINHPVTSGTRFVMMQWGR